MINYYEILEVSKNASKEVIDKAYRVLAKKYHPDLQQGQDKIQAENKMKEINEAYDVLSDDNKREEYNSFLESENERKKEKEIENKIEERQKNLDKNKQEEQISKQVNSNSNNDDYDYERQRQAKLQNEMNKAYIQAYKDYWRSRGYKIKEPWTWKRFIELLKVILILVIIIVVIWFFPPTHKLLVDMYNDNTIIKTLVDIFGNIFRGIGNGIYNFFKSIIK